MGWGGGAVSVARGWRGAGGIEGGEGGLRHHISLKSGFSLSLLHSETRSDLGEKWTSARRRIDAALRQDGRRSWRRSRCSWRGRCRGGGLRVIWGPDGWRGGVAAKP